MHLNLFAIADKLYRRLCENGIQFNQFGYPIIPPEQLVTNIPDEIIPFDRKNTCRNPERTILCFFRNDELLYPCLNRLDEDNEIFCNFMGVCGFDLSPRREHDIKLQNFNLLMNRMVDAYRAVHGVKILPNFRTGNLSTLASLTSVPPESCFIAGTLGCSRGYVLENSTLLKAKLLYARPQHMLIYGTLRSEYAAILDEFGQSYTIFDSWQDISRREYRHDST